MTTLGKILAFVVLVFAVVTAALEVMVYVTRTNWKSGFEKMKTNLEVAQADSAAARADKQKAIDEYNAKVLAANAQTAQVTTERDQIKKDLDNTRTQLDDARKAVDKSIIIEKDSAAAQERLQKDVEVLQKKLAQRDAELVDKAKENASLQSQTVRAQLDASSFKDRVQSLTEELERLARENEKLQTKVASGPALVSNVSSNGSAKPDNPPPEYIRGQVTAADPSTGLVTVSLGSDAGLGVNNTLKMYRLKPEPVYLGTLRIIDVRHHEAVGRAEDPRKKQLIKVGDEVASDVLGPR